MTSKMENARYLCVPPFPSKFAVPFNQSHRLYTTWKLAKHSESGLSPKTVRTAPAPFGGGRRLYRGIGLAADGPRQATSALLDSSIQALQPSGGCYQPPLYNSIWSNLSPEVLFKHMEKVQILEVDDLVQQGTVSHLSDEEVIIESDMKAFHISSEDFKELQGSLSVTKSSSRV